MSQAELKKFTYQTRLAETTEQAMIFIAYAKHMSQIERNLFADLQRGKNIKDLKSDYLEEFGITSRQFNSIQMKLEGKIKSIQECRITQIRNLKDQITSFEEKIKKLTQKKENSNKVHQKKRRLFNLKNRFARLNQDEDSGVVRLCFGSKKLYHAQFFLKKNGYTSHEEWQNEWRQTRNNSFYLVGSKDETSGNQSCTATIAEDGSLTLRLRLPNALIPQYGKYIIIHNVRFEYGHDVIVANIRNCQSSDQNNDAGIAISYLFQQDEKGWRLFATTEYAQPDCISRIDLGAIGVDINADHLAAVETDRFGNPIQNKVIPLVCYGKSQAQVKALIGDAAKEIVNWAIETQKPIVLEKLDFQKKKIALRDTGSRKLSRTLSSFAYSAIIEGIKSRSYRYAVLVKEINPAYTSVIGQVKFASRYGLSIHESAALVIARRSLGFSERLPYQLAKVPDGKNSHVALPLPVRNRGKHVWVLWRQVKKKLRVVLTAHFWAIKRSPGRQIPACCDELRFPSLVGEIPTHESLVELLD